MLLHQVLCVRLSISEFNENTVVRKADSLQTNYPNNSLPPVPNFTYVNILVTELHDHAHLVWAEVGFL